jgi:hypothetical protein
MAMLVHEVWEELSDGMVLHSLCMAGPRGDGERQFLEPGARLLTTFEAGSHFEAMVIYHRYLGQEAYTTNQPQDHQPYPDEWLTAQQAPEL